MLKDIPKEFIENEIFSKENKYIKDNSDPIIERIKSYKKKNIIFIAPFFLILLFIFIELFIIIIKEYTYGI
jgi:uncharacterized membrane protein YvbJ